MLTLRPPKPKTVVSAPDVSRCVLLKNCFDPAEETGDSWARELEEDVKHECESKYGKVSNPFLLQVVAKFCSSSRSITFTSRRNLRVKSTSSSTALVPEKRPLQD